MCVKEKAGKRYVGLCGGFERRVLIRQRYVSVCMCVWMIKGILSMKFG